MPVTVSKYRYVFNMIDGTYLYEVVSHISAGQARDKLWEYIHHGALLRSGAQGDLLAVPKHSIHTIEMKREIQ
jgi:hypothetical protein